jgi:hypothetical protein
MVSIAGLLAVRLRILDTQLSFLASPQARFAVAGNAVEA